MTKPPPTEHPRALKLVHEGSGRTPLLLPWKAALRLADRAARCARYQTLAVMFLTLAFLGAIAYVLACLGILPKSTAFHLGGVELAFIILALLFRHLQIDPLLGHFEITVAEFEEMAELVREDVLEAVENAVIFKGHARRPHPIEE